MRTLNDINFDYAQAAAKAGEHAFHIKSLQETIEKHEFDIEKLHNKMSSLQKEAQSIPKETQPVQETVLEAKEPEVTIDPV